MRKITIAAILAAGTVTPAFAQSATGVGVGIAKSQSTSASQATAIGGGNATGGTGVGSVNINSSTPPVQTVNQVASGTQTLKNVPTVFAPGMTAAGLETCLGSFSVGAGWLGAGLTGGSTVPDPGCQARLDARTLWSFGLKKAAVARLCAREDIYRSMPEVCVQYLPVAPAGYVAPVAYPVTADEGWRGAYNASGSILLIDGKTGKERLCNHYDAPKQRCQTWAYTHAAPPKKKASSSVQAPLPKVITDPPPASPKAADSASSVDRHEQHQ